MKRLLHPALCALFLLGLQPLSGAQSEPEIVSRLEPDSIGIGDRFDLVIEVDKDLVQTIAFPVFEPGDHNGFELVEDLPADTLLRDGRRMKLRKRYRMAAFEEGRFNLGRAAVLYADKNVLDTLPAGDSLYLFVGTFQIDSTSHAIFDLKPQKTLPFKLAEIRTYLLIGLLALVVLLAGVWLLLRYLKARGKSLNPFRAAPALPPHVAAIKALEALHHQKLWQNNRHKQYYSGLTDILRTYIAARWEFGAMEMTSDEIIAAAALAELPDKARADLVSVLRNADLVKFAKALPEAEQNEADYLKCYYFVEETKQADTAEQEATLDEKMNR